MAEAIFDKGIVVGKQERHEEGCVAVAAQGLFEFQLNGMGKQTRPVIEFRDNTAYKRRASPSELSC